MPLLAGCAQVAGRYRRYGEKLALCQHAGGSRSWASYDQVCADVQRGLRTTTWRVAPLSRVGLHAEPAPPRQSQSPVQLVWDQLPRMLAAVVGMVPGGQTDSRTASPVSAAAIKGRTRRPAGAAAVCSWTSAVPLATCRRSGCPAGVSAVSAVLAASAAPGLGKGPKCSNWSPVALETPHAELSAT